MVDILDRMAAPDGIFSTLRRPGRPKNPCDGAPVTRFSGSYGSRDYWLARLIRDERIELAAAVRAGTMTANAAAILAGFRKRTTRKKRSSLAAVEALIG
jgi:hypothetical protein